MRPDSIGQFEEAFCRSSEALRTSFCQLSVATRRQNERELSPRIEFSRGRRVAIHEPAMTCDPAKKHVPTKREKPRAAAPIVAFVGRTTRQNALEEVGRWSLVDGHYLTSASGARDFPADPVLRCPFEGVTTPAGCNDPAGVPHRWRQTLEKQRVTAGWDGPICLTGPVRPFIIEIVVSAQPFRSAEAAPFAAIAPVAPSPASCR